MDVKYINPCISGAVEVLKTMAFVNPIAGKPYVKTTSNAHGEVSGIIGITGDAIGSLAISFTNSCICHIAGNMLGETFTELTRDVLDAVGEITNMISGVARTKMEKEGMSVYAAIPSVVYGSDHTIDHILKNPSIVIPFSTARGAFVIDVCIRKTQAKEITAAAYGVKNIDTLAVGRNVNRLLSGQDDLRPPSRHTEPPVRENGRKPDPPPAGEEGRKPDPPPAAPPAPRTPEEKLEVMKARLAELIAARNAMRQQLTDKPFLEAAKRQLYKKNIPLFDARIKRLKLDIAAVEMLIKMTPEELANPKVITHYQHYGKKR